MTTQNEGLMTDIDKDMEALRAEAAATDGGESISSAETPDNGTSNNSEIEPEDDNATDSQRSDTPADTKPQSDAKDKDKTKSEAPAKKEGESDGKQTNTNETPYAGKKRGAQARIEELAREKNEAKERAEALQRQLDELKKTPAKPAETEEPKDKKPAVKGDPYPQYTIEELEQAAEDFDAEGNTDMAKNCRKAILAKAKAIADSKTEDTQAAQQRAHEEFSAGWKATLGEMVKEDPKLATDDYPLTKEVQSLVKHDKWGRFFLAHPDGARAALEVGKLRLAAARVSDLEKQVAELTKEKTRLEGLTAINPAPPTPREADRKFEEMSADEQLEALRKDAERLDG